MSSIKKNFLFSTILTASNYIFPFLIFPYVSRVLGVENIGICNFVDSIINYFMLLSMMGISVIGIREIAAAKGNKNELNKTFTSLFVLSLGSTIIALIALLSVILFVEVLLAYKALLYIGIIKLLGNFFLIDWLYRGLEDFKYITIRTIFVKLGYLVAVFALVHAESDYYIYYVLLCLMIAVNAVFNCVKASKIIKLDLKNLSIGQYFTPFIILGVYMFLTSLYTTFNIAYLGFVSGDVEVGYYTTATKFYGIIIAVYTAFTGVMLPRMSTLLSENKHKEFIDLANKSTDMLMTISIPIVIFVFCFSKEIITLFAGDGYSGAVMPLKIVIPLVFIIGYEQILIIQMLTPLKKDKAIFCNSVIGACVGVALNIVLVPQLSSIGSSIVWLISEVIVLISAQYFVFRYIGFNFPYKAMIKNISSYIPFVGLCIWLHSISDFNSNVLLSVGIILSLFYFVLIQNSVIKNELYLAYQMKIAKYIGIKNNIKYK